MDIKPENIQLTVRDEWSVLVKLFDFGIARIQNQAAVTEIRSGPPSTLAYSAPEVHRSAEYLSPAIDVYALGITLFEMVAKERPFIGHGLDVVWAHLQEAPPRLSQRRQDIKLPARLDDLTAQTLEKDPALRPTMTQVVQQLTTLGRELAAESARSVHALRTYVLPSKQSERPAEAPAPAPIPNGPRTALQVIVSAREIDQIETERDQIGAQLESECKGMLRLYWAPDVPAELLTIVRRCSEIKATRKKLESFLVTLQDALLKDKAELQTRRNELRQQLHAQRDELRALPADAGSRRQALTEQLAQLERSYAAASPTSATATQVQNEGIRGQQLRAELLETQRTLAEQLLRTAQSSPQLASTKSAGRGNSALKMATQQLATLLGQLDTLDQSLRQV